MESERENLVINESEDDTNTKPQDLNDEHMKRLNSDCSQKSQKSEEEAKLITSDEQDNIVAILGELQSKLKGENEKINKEYEKLLKNEDLLQREINGNKDTGFNYFMFHVIAMLFSTIFLIGTFQLISLKSALWDLLKESGSKYIECTFKNNCTIYGNSTSIEADMKNNNNTRIVYEFYDYFHNTSMTETIDFNLMMITGFIGDSLLNSIGFGWSYFVLSLFNFGGILWIFCFNFEFKEFGIFDYGWPKILSIFVIYIILLIGIGGSALLSQKIIVDGLNKYKTYKINKKLRELNTESNNNPEMMELKDKKDDKTQNYRPIKTTRTIRFRKGDLRGEDDIKKEKQYLKERENNKFDFYFIICVDTTFGYFGKYGINLLLDKLLEFIFDKKEYEKGYYLLGITILYFISFVLSLVFYCIFFSCFFTKNNKGENTGNEYSICQICGYIIYSQNIIKDKSPPLSGFKKFIKSFCEAIKLCCESTNHCCNIVGCSLCNRVRVCEKKENENNGNNENDDNEINNCECYCCCCCPEYNKDDYKKKKEFFCYCYQMERKSYRCDQFFTNKIQKKIVPYMLVYFSLQLTTIAFQQIHEDKKNYFVHKKTFMLIFLSCFYFFFYFSISLYRFNTMVENDDTNGDDDMDNDKEELFQNNFPEEDDKIQKVIRKSKKSDNVSKMSHETKNGLFAILLFNGTFSFIFSFIYLFHKSNKFKEYIFENNMNIIFIPILMNKFYYFTLNYYYTYTSEVNKKFNVFSSSTLISMYLLVYDFIIWAIKFIISLFTTHYYIQVLIVIQIICSFIPSIIVVGVPLVEIFTLIFCSENGCGKEEIRGIFKLFYCLLSFLICCGGFWFTSEGFCDCDCVYCDELSCCDYIDCNLCNKKDELEVK